MPGVQWYDYYEPGDRADVDALLRDSPAARLVTVAEDGTPHIGLYPHVWDGQRIRFHLTNDDEQAADLRAGGPAIAEVDDLGAVIPSYWVDPTYGGVATLYHRTVVVRGPVSFSADPRDVRDTLVALLAKQQPEGGHDSVSLDDPRYLRNVRRLVSVDIAAVEVRAKWKLAQNREPEQRRHVIAQLRERARPRDLWTADLLERELAHDLGTASARAQE